MANPLAAREQVRERGWERIVGGAAADLTYAVRRLRKDAAFTALAVLTLALGIGAATAIFSTVNPVLFERLPYPDPERLVMISDVGTAGARLDVTYGTYRELAQRSRSFASLAVLKAWQPTLGGRDAPERLDGQRVSAGLLPDARRRPAARARLHRGPTTARKGPDVVDPQLRAVAAPRRRRRHRRAARSRWTTRR